MNCSGGQANQCQSCDSSQFRVSSNNIAPFSCNCQDGYYEENGKCQLCDPSCLTCNGGSDTNCITCDQTNKFRLIQSGKCICQNTYYDNNDKGICQKCQSPCKDCSLNGSNIQCLSCQQSIKVLQNGNCICPSKYYEDTSKNCQQCISNCLQCKNNSSCDQCDINRIFSSNQCICKDGFFNLSGNCQICDSTCLRCSGALAIQCLQCDASKQRVLSGTICNCMDKYYEDINKICIHCIPYCLSCKINNVGCDQCDTNRILLQNQCVCKDGFYDEGGICQPCDQSCLKCNGPLDSQCLACDSSKNRQLSGSFCVCKSNYYDNYDKGVCPKCINPLCIECMVTPTNKLAQLCINCQDPNRYVQNGVCLCKNSMYEDSVTKKCNLCVNYCKSCTNNISCDQCQDNREFKSNQCLCKDGLFDNGGTCQLCHKSCSTCNGSSERNCTACTSLRSFQLTPKQCVCNNKYFQDSNLDCLPCHYSCGSCLIDNTETSCTMCDSSSNRIPSPSSSATQFKCICKDKFFNINNNINCSSCNPTCAQCDGSANNCTKCDEITRTLKGSQCVCIDGYYYINQNDVSCQQCFNKCATCQSGSTANNICQLCRLTDNRILSGNNCVCKIGYFEATSTAVVCSQCQITCLTCLNGVTCETCDDKLFRILNATKQCVCQDGYYEDSGVCKKCHYSCTTCTGGLANSCKSCSNQNFRVMKLGNTCTCQDNYYDDSTNQACLKCHYTCFNCINSLPNMCISCGNQAINFRQKQDNIPVIPQFNCFCQDKYFDDGANNNICQRCQYSCSTCKQRDVCLSCDTDSFRELVNKGAGKVYCDCQHGYFEDPTKVCQKCSVNCKTCIDTKDKCTECKSEENRVLDGSTQKCLCKDGLYEDPSKVCKNCNFTCLTCIGGDLKTNCLTCSQINNREPKILNTKTTCPCKDKFYEINNQPKCESCHYSCKTCTKDGNYNSCDTCDSTLFRIITTDGRCICQPGYVENNQVCVPCHKSCQECNGISQNDCTKCDFTLLRVQSSSSSTSFQCLCLSSYYQDSNIKCQKCHFSCLECRGPNPGDCYKCQDLHMRIPSNPTAATFTCDCKEKFYSDYLNSLCLACYYSCKNCIGGNTLSNCIDCNQSKGRLSISQQNLKSPIQGQCLCKEAMYDDGSNELCGSCHITCKYCQGSSKGNCTICYEDRNFIRLNTLVDKSECICKPQHFYDSSQNTCIQCHPLCQSCKGSKSGDCLTCFPHQKRVLKGTQCICPQRFYQLKQNYICEPCHYTCQNCFGASPFDCIDCNNSALRVFNQKYLTCECLKGYYGQSDSLKDENCLKCDPLCQTCAQDSNRCTNCINNLVIIDQVTQKCQCNQQEYYDIFSNYCQPCHFTCQECEGPDKDQCISCKSNYFPQKIALSLKTNKQIYQCNCDPSQRSCLQCHSSCEVQSCDPQNLNICITCPAHSHLTSLQIIQNKQQRFCACDDGFYEDLLTQKCQNCHFTCQTCSGPTQQECISCKDPDINLREAISIKNESSMLVECICKPGFYEQDNQLLCLKCHPSCETCSGSFSYCITCPLNSFLSSPGVCSCNPSFIFMDSLGQCLQCHHSCKYCDGLGEKDCLSCNSLTRIFELQNYSKQLGTCNCQLGYFDVGKGECQKCHHSCQKCIGKADFCLECPSQLSSHRFFQNSKCPCLKRFYESQSGNCLPCPYDCEYCDQQNNCNSCDSDERYLDPITKRCNCYVGTYEVADRTCASCDLNCESCENTSKQCVHCHPNSFLNFFNACICKDGYYEDKIFYKNSISLPREDITRKNQNEMCQKCYPTCKTCDNKDTCLSCDNRKFTVLNPKTNICDCFYGRTLVIKDDGTFVCELLDSYFTQQSGQQEQIHILLNKIMNFLFEAFQYLGLLSLLLGRLYISAQMLMRVFDIQLLLYFNIMQPDNLKVFLSPANSSNLYRFLDFINPFSSILQEDEKYYLSSVLKEYSISTNIYDQAGGQILFFLIIHLINFILRRTIFHKRYILIDQYYKVIKGRILLSRLYNLYFVNIHLSLENVISYYLFFFCFIGIEDSRLVYKLPSFLILISLVLIYFYKIKNIQSFFQDPFDLLLNNPKSCHYTLKMSFIQSLASSIQFYLFFSQKDQWSLVWVLSFRLIVLVPIQIAKFRNKKFLKFSFVVQELLYSTTLISSLLVSVKTRKNLVDEDQVQDILIYCVIFKSVTLSLLFVCIITLIIDTILEVRQILFNKFDYETTINNIYKRIYGQDIEVSKKNKENDVNQSFVKIGASKFTQKTSKLANLFKNKFDILNSSQIRLNKNTSVE